ncbi:MAG: DUF1738 domain-containing protein, partial [Caedimonas sp.]|nr:DUF1738 domain-containing protein [Caedimonas sp.]
MNLISQKDYKKLPGNRKRQREGQKQEKNLEKKSDIYTCVTNKIIADLEQGKLTWQKPWNTHHLEGRIAKPLRHDGTPYQGINVILLWAASAEHGYTS